MKKRSFLHHFQSIGIRTDCCMVHIFENGNERHIVFEDIDGGMSVTNASEQIATEIVNEYKLDPDFCWFYETYQQFDYETFEEIEYNWVIGDKDVWTANSPVWKEDADFKNVFLKSIKK